MLVKQKGKNLAQLGAPNKHKPLKQIHNTPNQHQYYHYDDFDSFLLATNSLCMVLHMKSAHTACAAYFPRTMPSQLQWLSQQEFLPYILKGADWFYPTYPTCITHQVSKNLAISQCKGSIIYEQFNPSASYLENKSYELSGSSRNLFTKDTEGKKSRICMLFSLTNSYNSYFPFTSVLNKQWETGKRPISSTISVDWLVTILFQKISFVILYFFLSVNNFNVNTKTSNKLILLISFVFVEAIPLVLSDLQPEHSDQVGLWQTGATHFIKCKILQAGEELWLPGLIDCDITWQQVSLRQISPYITIAQMVKCNLTPHHFQPSYTSVFANSRSKGGFGMIH